MAKIIDSDPAKYSETNIPESDAIRVLNFIINLNNVKTEIKTNDKIPNIDGYLEITEDDQTPIGKIEVQIKKLSNNDIDNPKYQCNKKFLSYCENNILPVLIIVADTTNIVAYWRHIDKDFLKCLKIKGESVNVNIEIENIIKKGNSNYLEKWKKIIRKYKIRINSYDNLFEIMKNLQNANNILSSNSDPIIGLEKPEYRKIHIFLDRLNFLLKTDFSIINKIFYNSCWKLGLAYTNYSRTEVSYVLYPINFEKNDLQIKEISKNVREKLSEEKHIFKRYIDYYSENPIEAIPEEHAYKIMQDYLKIIFDKKLLSIKHVSLCREMFFSFIDKFHECLGLEIKNQYTLLEIKDSFNNYFPIWLDEVVKTKKIILVDINYINLDFMVPKINKKDADELDRRVKERINKNQLVNDGFAIRSEKYPINLIIESLNFLSLENISDLERFYVPPNYDIITKIGVGAAYSSEDIMKNIKIFYQELPKAYDHVLESVFPSFKSKLNFFNGFNKLIIVVEIEDDMECAPQSRQLVKVCLREGKHGKNIKKKLYA